MMEFLIVQLFPMYTSLKIIEFSTLPLTIHPEEIILFFTSAPVLYFAGGRSSTLEYTSGYCLKK